MKDLELKVISELLKNDRRSDRELAMTLGVSQPTVSRTMKKLEQKGTIKEHTIIPDLKQLGIELVAFTFGNWKPEKIKDFTEDERVEKAKRFISKHPNVIYASSGRGLGKGRMIVTLHKNYSDYSEFMSQARAEWLGLVDLESFIISLTADTSPFQFSLRNVGEYLRKKD
jgi:DNA-binding Lrp family transcriptional regulator